MLPAIETLYQSAVEVTNPNQRRVQHRKTIWTGLIFLFQVFPAKYSLRTQLLLNSIGFQVTPPSDVR